MPWFRFFAFDPRAAAARWALWFAATLAALWLATLALSRAEGAAVVAVFAALGALAAKLTTESVRRLHDCGQSGRQGLAPGLGVLALVVTATLHGMGAGADLTFWGAWVLAALAVAALMLRPGNAGSNAYGPAPPSFAPSRGGAGDRAGAIVAIGIVVASAALGGAVLRWQAEKARQSEARTRTSLHGAAPPSPRVAGDEAAVSRDEDPLTNDNAALSNRIDDLLAAEGRR